MHEIEKLAEEATSLEGLGVNLPEIRRSVEDILRGFGRSGIFSEYTVHDIRHIDDMFETINWVIPSSTKKEITKSEWLLIVLSVYFHDIGLIVTSDEYEQRHNSGFAQYIEKIVMPGPNGQNYRAKISELSEEKAEKFYYQEFIRHHHAERVRAWVLGSAAPSLGVAKAQYEEIQRLLEPLSKVFRQELAKICESHNLDDIDDEEKYKLVRAFGNSEELEANIQYCAIILRAVDLLQFTHRRAPSVEYRMINPTDPVSQAEWAKQNAVTRIKASPVRGENGEIIPNASSDTIEVHADFTDETGFFGLTAYLLYARDQLKECSRIAAVSQKKLTKPYEFPWAKIDDSSVRAEGFIERPFGFELDQEKILNLLTGHTLYNDSNVVLRELAQNSIDAVRLKWRGQSATKGLVHVSWNPSRRELTVRDNGTGMSQEVIENHFLKVGSSRYQDPRFKEDNPDFSPISRFGIGVLSAFMVADEVEVITVDPAEEQARRISLRSVHGKYLIRLLDKDLSTVREIGSHGTLVKLKFRSTANEIDVQRILRNWILYPRCKVQYVGHEEGVVDVGYTSPKVALKEYCDLVISPQFSGEHGIKVEEKSVSGFTLAFARRFNKHYREWGFVSNIGRPRGRDREAVRPPIATCVEGIAVDFSSPGFSDASLLMSSNAVGEGAPKTNVARSSIESLAEKEEIARKVYRILLEAAVEECERLQNEEGYSLTWAMEQLPYIISPIVSDNRSRAAFWDALEEELTKFPIYLLEDGNGRRRMSLVDLGQIESFWTVESALMRSVEQFVKEAKAEITARELLGVSQGTATSLPSDKMVVNAHRSDLLQSLLNTKFEIAEIHGHIAERRLDFKWKTREERWFSKETLRQEIVRTDDRQLISLIQSTDRSRTNTDVMIAIGDVRIEGLKEHYAAQAHGAMFFFPDTDIAQYISEQLKSPYDEEAQQRLYFMLEAMAGSGEFDIEDMTRHVERYYRQIQDNLPKHALDGRDVLMSLLNDMEPSLAVYWPLSWGQRRMAD